MTAATTPIHYHYINDHDTKQSALDVQRWILHLAVCSSDCRCIICININPIGGTA